MNNNAPYAVYERLCGIVVNRTRRWSTLESRWSVMGRTDSVGCECRVRRDARLVDQGEIHEVLCKKKLRRGCSNVLKKGWSSSSLAPWRQLFGLTTHPSFLSIHDHNTRLTTIPLDRSRNVNQLRLQTAFTREVPPQSAKSQQREAASLQFRFPMNHRIWTGLSTMSTSHSSAHELKCDVQWLPDKLFSLHGIIPVRSV
jgi:hypothetical protein